MSRFLTNDFLNKDPRALLTAEKIATVADIVTPAKQYITATTPESVTVSGDCIICISGTAVFKTQAAVLGVSNLDQGTFQVGKDYYIYICDPGGDNDERYIISLNSTYPVGWNANNSRKIGGFHYGVCRRTDTRLRPLNANDEAFGVGWESAVYNGILPRSVWTLHHRPKCNPEGMVYLAHGVWVDIYQFSDDGAGGVASRHSATPMTGTEGMNWYSFNERAAVVGKRLLTYAEFCQMAMGSPEGLAGSNENAWTAATARTVTGSVRNAVSSIGCRDAVGNVWEWLDTFITRAEHTTINGAGTFGANEGGRAGQAFTNGNGHYVAAPAANSAALGRWTWDTFSPFPGYGNIYEYYDYSLVALVGGGYWGYSVYAGARAVYLSIYPWRVSTSIGGRGACDSL